MGSYSTLYVTREEALSKIRVKLDKLSNLHLENILEDLYKKYQFCISEEGEDSEIFDGID